MDDDNLRAEALRERTYMQEFLEHPDPRDPEHPEDLEDE